MRDLSRIILQEVLSKEDPGIPEKYLVIKPRILSDENIKTTINLIRLGLSFTPGLNLVNSMFSLGEIGLTIWKRIAFDQEHQKLSVPPTDPNVIKLSIQFDDILYTYCKEVLDIENLDQADINKLEKIYSDFSFITSVNILKAKYPEIPEEYILTTAEKNKKALQRTLSSIEDDLREASILNIMDNEIETGIESFKVLFPEMRNWALFNEESRDEIISLLED